MNYKTRWCCILFSPSFIKTLSIQINNNTISYKLTVNIQILLCFFSICLFELFELFFIQNLSLHQRYNTQNNFLLPPSHMYSNPSK